MIRLAQRHTAWPVRIALSALLPFAAQAVQAANTELLPSGYYNTNVGLSLSGDANYQASKTLNNVFGVLNATVGSDSQQPIGIAGSTPTVGLGLGSLTVARDSGLVGAITLAHGLTFNANNAASNEQTGMTGGTATFNQLRASFDGTNTVHISGTVTGLTANNTRVTYTGELFTGLVASSPTLQVGSSTQLQITALAATAQATNTLLASWGATTDGLVYPSMLAVRDWGSMTVLWRADATLNDGPGALPVWPTQVPEPGTAALMALGGLAIWARARRAAQAASQA